MRWLSLVLLAGLVGCASAATDEAEASAGAVSTQTGPIPTSELPDPHGFVSWSEEDLLVSPPRPADVARVTVSCADKKLYPTHPQSTLKRYHRYAHARYDNTKLSGDDEMCKTPQRVTSGSRKACLAPEVFEYAVLSDTYTDSCGNLYRGFWELRFRGQDESMGTLFSRGRTVYDVPDSQFEGEVYDGPTYAVDAQDFMFLSKLLPKDAEGIAKDQASAKTTHTLNATTHLFEYVGKYR